MAGSRLTRSRVGGGAKCGGDPQDTSDDHVLALVLPT